MPSTDAVDGSSHQIRLGLVSIFVIVQRSLLSTLWIDMPISAIVVGFVSSSCRYLTSCQTSSPGSVVGSSSWRPVDLQVGRIRRRARLALGDEVRAVVLAEAEVDEDAPPAAGLDVRPAGAGSRPGRCRTGLGVEEVVAELERDAHVREQPEAGAVGAGVAGAERGHDDVLLVDPTAAVEVEQQICAGSRPEAVESGHSSAQAVVDEVVELLRDLTGLDAVASVGRARQLGRELGERGHDVVVEGADDVRAAVECVADDRNREISGGAVELRLEVLEQLRQHLEEQREVDPDR